jgi:diaminobutyrate-2-oxoglutarate transaminase
MNIFNNIESEVRRYCRAFPTIFTKAEGYKVIDQNGKRYIDFFSGSGSLNYGHNNPAMKQKLLEYISENGIVQGLDMATDAKRNFLKQFYDIILKKRNMDYKLQFPGPTGTNAVEAALKLVRKVTGRNNIACFTNSFHGMTLGALSVSFNASKKVTDKDAMTKFSVTMPFDGFFGEEYNSLNYIESYLKISRAKSDLPAAFILETIQCEGGINIATTGWLRELEKILKAYEVLLIIDDIQAGCGRTGTFFSFETSEIKPDIICLSKSLSGYGLPLALVLIKPELDVWQPGEHSGTFRGNNLAFVTATEALNYWRNNEFGDTIRIKSNIIPQRLSDLVKKYPEIHGKVRGRGFLWGFESNLKNFSVQVARDAFQAGLLIETAGPKNQVLKLMPPLITDEKGLNAGLDILQECLMRNYRKEL